MLNLGSKTVGLPSPSSFPNTLGGYQNELLSRRLREQPPGRRNARKDASFSLQPLRVRSLFPSLSLRPNIWGSARIPELMHSRVFFLSHDVCVTRERWMPPPRRLPVSLCGMCVSLARSVARVALPKLGRSRIFSGLSCVSLRRWHTAACMRAFRETRICAFCPFLHSPASLSLSRLASVPFSLSLSLLFRASVSVFRATN